MFDQMVMPLQLMTASTTPISRIDVDYSFSVTKNFEMFKPKDVHLFKPKGMYIYLQKFEPSQTQYGLCPYQPSCHLKSYLNRPASSSLFVINQSRSHCCNMGTCIL